MSRWPLVSIVTPSLDQGRFIRATIESILSQDYPNLEYWVMDGGSKDATLEILRSYGDRLYWVSEADGGQSQAVNKGWKRSQGEILGWVNADDLLEPLAVRFAVDALLARPDVGALYGDTVYIDEVDKVMQAYPTRPFNYEALVGETENFIPQPSVFMRRNVLEKAGFLNEALHYVMDYDLWLRIGLITPMEYLPIKMAALRLHASAKTVKAMSQFANEFALMYENLFLNPTLPEALQRRQIEIMHTAYVHSASFCFWGGETRMALHFLQKAWRLRRLPRRRTFWYLLAFSLFGKVGWKLAELLHGNPMQLRRGLLIR
jgi:glycosyltransferase involved in cell wall biosynthesis